MENKTEKKTYVQLVDGHYVQSDSPDILFDYEKVFFELPNFGMFPPLGRCISSEVKMQTKVSNVGGSSLFTPGNMNVTLRDKSGTNGIYRRFLVATGLDFSEQLMGGLQFGQRRLRKGDEITIPFHLSGIEDFPKIMNPMNGNSDKMISLMYAEISGYYLHDIRDYLTLHGVNQMKKQLWNEIMEYLWRWNTRIFVPSYMQLTEGRSNTGKGELVDARKEVDKFIKLITFGYDKISSQTRKYSIDSLDGYKEISDILKEIISEFVELIVMFDKGPEGSSSFMLKSAKEVISRSFVDGVNQKDVEKNIFDLFMKFFIRVFLA